MSGVRVRSARASDAAFLSGLVPAFAEFGLPEWRDPQAFLAMVERSLRGALESGATVLIAEDERGAPLGFVHLHPAPDLGGGMRAHVSDLAVAEEARGRGVGRVLIEAAEKWARDHGFSVLGLNAIATNEAALRFYERLGFGRDTVTLVKRV